VSEEQRMEAIEREMMAMRPKGVPAGVMKELVAEMSQPRRAWGDWMLVGAMGSGVAAAVVIVSMLWLQTAGDAPAPVNAPVMAAGRPQRVGDYLAMYARADGIGMGL
jgi:hypothetical protein